MVSTLGISEFKQRRFLTTHVNRKWAFFSFSTRWRYQICITKGLFDQNFVQNHDSNQKCKKSLLPVDEPEVEPALLFKQLERRTSTGCGLIPNLGRDVDQIFGQIIFMREKTLKNTNLVVSRHIKRENGSLPVDVHRSKTFLLKLPIVKSIPLQLFMSLWSIP